jgi:hypothetical protein
MPGSVLDMPLLISFTRELILEEALVLFIATTSVSALKSQKFELELSVEIVEDCPLQILFKSLPFCPVPFSQIFFLIFPITVSFIKERILTEPLLKTSAKEEAPTLGPIIIARKPKTKSIFIIAFTNILYHTINTFAFIEI